MSRYERFKTYGAGGQFVNDGKKHILFAMVHPLSGRKYGIDVSEDVVDGNVVVRSNPHWFMSYLKPVIEPRGGYVDVASCVEAIYRIKERLY